ncbi:MAG: hypothetical protein COV29_04235 [Candidatus Yanofskybacteria bacterium CG10_big_fil_rev_8_21_14_0_10_36_16]|uniref:Uncharacterized protein n=1 Tax=Candidatus Yanofskybacteria bacterium CG10_big_fil_rev_8_21_14_0_10_36_16 TaxID=1975096 RepID=A0A2J0Q6D3_9BACT|nr:MAG: hypothetical protein COV29_04235 [Candidatus Yanofskybacteria bacterium CG10_big_fil_rev_8_21_14_0_10_36_16]
MPNILQEIRKQPEHIREIFMWISVFVVSSLVIFTWFKSAQDDMYAMLHPEEVEQQRILAEQEKENQPSLFAAIGGSVSGFKDTILELVGVKEDLPQQGDSGQPDVGPQRLPLVE